MRTVHVKRRYKRVSLLPFNAPQVWFPGEGRKERGADLPLIDSKGEGKLAFEDRHDAPIF